MGLVVKTALRTLRSFPKQRQRAKRVQIDFDCLYYLWAVSVLVETDTVYSHIIAIVVVVVVD